MSLPISACLIAKNSEQTLEKCLKSLIKNIDEIILIDTGSTDNTLKIAAKYKCKIHELDWVDDFSYIRNKAIEYSKNEWILVIDTDEELVLNNKNKFEEFLNSKHLDSFYIFRKEILSKEERAINIFARIFLKSSSYKFVGQIHEYLEVNPDSTALIDEKIIYLNHYGYNQSYSEPEEKYKRNVDILRKQIHRTDIDFWNKVYFRVCLSKELLFKQDNYSEIKLLLKEVEQYLLSVTEKEIRQNTICLEFHKTFTTFYLLNKEYSNAKSIVKISLERYPNDITLISMAGDLCFQHKDFENSLNLYKSIIRLVENNKQLLASCNHEGTMSYGTLYNIALCYFYIEDYELSFEYLEKTLETKPIFKPAINLLSKLKTKLLENNKN